MALDGINVNQLRILNESSTNDASSRLSGLNDVKAVDKLADGQKINPDKDKPKEEFFSDDENEDENNEDELNNDEHEEIIKIDLSNGDKYALQYDDDNTVLIIDKTTKQIVQKIDAESLSNFVNNLSASQGCFVNRKF